MKIRSMVQPQSIEITPTAVFINSNVIPYEEVVDGKILQGYEYDCIEYTKDEYLIHQNEQIAALTEELEATKILLGVD